MSLWEYKVITSGKGGFATPALLEKFLNDLGRDEWEIIQYQTPPDNFLAFTGLARRSTQRDWTLQDAAAAAAKVEAEKLRLEFEAKFKAASTPATAVAEERTPSFLEEKSAPDDGLRKLVDTSRDSDPEVQEDDKPDEWDNLSATEEEELPTFFEAMRPHMRRNQRGPGMSVGVDYLAKKWDQSEDDLKGALVECGFVMPADEDSPVEYVEYDGDLFWLNINRRGELWINTKEKPRPVFRAVKAARFEVEAPKTENTAPKSDSAEAPAAEASPVATPESGEAKPEGQSPAPESTRPSGAGLPEGAALLAKIRPLMRRNRRGPGGSGSMSFLSRALRTKEADLKAAFVALGLTAPTSPNDKPVYTEIGQELWWLNLDSRNGLWINGREKKDAEPAETPAAADASTAAAPAAPSGEATASSTAETTPPMSMVPATTDANASLAPATEAVPAPTTDATLATEPPPLPWEVASAAPASAPAPAPVPEPAVAPAPTPTAESAPASAPAAAPAPEAAASEPTPAAAPVASEPAPLSPPPVINAALAAVRVHLRETRNGAIAGRIERLAEDLGQSPADLLATLTAAGLKIPEKAREKLVYAEHAGEVLWLSKSSRGELWLNARLAKLATKDAEAEDPEGESDGDASTEGEVAGTDSDGDKKPQRRAARPRPKKVE